jgi:hypothetical protein
MAVLDRTIIEARGVARQSAESAWQRLIFHGIVGRCRPTLQYLG